MKNKRIIYATPEGGVAVIIPADCGLTIEEIAAKDVPEGVAYLIVEGSAIPTDRTFRNAWKYDKGVKTNIVQAKEITHEARRAARSADFAPLDVKATIPSEASAAEDARSKVRAKYADIQTSIDGAADVATLKTIIETLKK